MNRGKELCDYVLLCYYVYVHSRGKITVVSVKYIRNNVEFKS